MIKVVTVSLMRIRAILVVIVVAACLSQLCMEQPAFARASRLVDCSEQHWMLLLANDDAAHAYAGKLHAMLTAAETRAACLDNAGDDYASMVDDAANQYDSAGDEAFLMGNEPYSCTLHGRALALENKALARRLNAFDRGLIGYRRADTLRSMQHCH